MNEAKSWFFARCRGAWQSARRLGFAALAVLGLASTAQAQVTLVATNVVEDAATAFNTAGTIGLAILTFLVGLGAVMMGWRVSRGRGK